jgi:succinate dehydrogenase/fumarate reductase-like Fe-S protein
LVAKKQMLTDEQINDYIDDVIKNKTLESEMYKIRELMVYSTTHNIKKDVVVDLNKVFKALLKLKELLHATAKINEGVQCEQKEDTSKNV